MNKQQLIHFLILFAILVLGIFVFFYENGNHSTQLMISIITSFFYMLWGVAHHALRHDLHRKVVIEYILIGAIAIALFTIVLSP